MPTLQRISVYIADDHPVYRKGLSRALNEDPELYVVGVAEEGSTALKDLLMLRPNVAILDISMPNLSGIQILSELRAKGVKREEVRCILLTGSNSEDVIYSAMAQGAYAYILKTADWSDLRQAIKEVFAGKTIIAPEILSTLSEQIEDHANQKEKISLTPREREILSLIADGLSQEEIASRLQVSTATVRTHLRNGYAKLNVRTSTAAVAESFRQGLIS